jgi:hypothetical protein
MKIENIAICFFLSKNKETIAIIKLKKLIANANIIKDLGPSTKNE